MYRHCGYISIFRTCSLLNCSRTTSTMPDRASSDKGFQDCGRLPQTPAASRNYVDSVPADEFVCLNSSALLSRFIASVVCLPFRLLCVLCVLCGYPILFVCFPPFRGDCSVCFR